MAARSDPEVFTLRIVLAGHSPEIWRQLLVPATVRLDNLHLIFQAAMGWTNSHLHQFRTTGGRYGTHFDDRPEDELHEIGYRLADITSPGQRLWYDYDFGDSWEHEVLVETAGACHPALKYAVCIDGASACPPEDCGGTGGYADLLEALADPAHEDHAGYQTWAGEDFDPHHFDLAVANAALQRVR